jgi:hypothetical protein
MIRAINVDSVLDDGSVFKCIFNVGVHVYLLVYVWFADDVMVSVFILEHQMVE